MAPAYAGQDDQINFLRDWSKRRGADDIVIFLFGGLVLLGVSGGILRDLDDIIQVFERIRIPITRQDHQRVIHGAFGLPG